ncbi:MAG: DNA repair protein RadC [Rhodospirillales bacterium]|nr:DNA repair protein RadC [Rhodospirillales bacterium]
MSATAIAADIPIEISSFGSLPDVVSSTLGGLFDQARDWVGREESPSGPKDETQWADVAENARCSAVKRQIVDQDSALEQSEHPEDTSENIEVQDWKSLCSRLLSISEDSISDIDLLTLMLSYHETEKNARKMAAQLIRRFETFGNVVSARCTQITGAAEVRPELIDFFRLVRAAGTRLAREEISDRPVIDAWDKLLKYLRSSMAHQTEEQFRVLFLDRRNVLIADEVQHRGTIDHTPVYPREVAKRALELDASAIIMAHNHPSNHPAPSRGDIEMTRVVSDALERLGIVLHDHVIVSRRGHSSFRSMGLLGKKAVHC